MGTTVTLARPPGATAPVYGCAQRWRGRCVWNDVVDGANCPARMCGGCLPGGPVQSTPLTKAWQVLTYDFTVTDTATLLCPTWR